MAKSNDPQIWIRLPPGVKSALEQIAKADLRSVATLAELVLTDYARSRGYLPEAAAPPAETTKRRRK